MLVNSLIMGLILYNASVVYNLLTRKSLETVFYLGIKYLFYTILMTLFLQLSFYLIKDYRTEIATEKNSDSQAESGEVKKTEVETKTLEKAEADSSEVNNDFEEFEIEDFSAFSQDNVDSQ